MDGDGVCLGSGVWWWRGISSCDTRGVEGFDVQGGVVGEVGMSSSIEVYSIEVSSSIRACRL